MAVAGASDASWQSAEEVKALRKGRTILPYLSLAALVLGYCFIFDLPALPAQGRQKAVKSGSAELKQGKAAAGLDLAEANVFQSEMRNVIERYIADRGSLNRLYGVESSPNAPDRASANQPYTIELSPTRSPRMKQFYAEWLDRLGHLDFDAMSHDGRIDYLLLKNHLNQELRQLDIRAKALSEAAPLTPFRQTIIDLEEARRRMEAVDSTRSAAILNTLTKQIGETRKAVEARLKSDGEAEGKTEGAGIKKAIANRAAVTIEGLRGTLKDWFGFYNGYDPVFTWWVGEPYKAADQALQNYAAFLREKIIGVKAGEDKTIIGDPIERDALVSQLAYEMIPYTPEELIAIANKEFAWCEAEMKRASRELGYGDDWQKALEYVKTLYVEPGKQPELIRNLALEAIAYLDQHDLVTVPQLARETWRIGMMSPERQLVNPFFTGGEEISVSYPTNSMSHEQKMMSMRGNNIHFARATVFHELIPGHHLQSFMAARYRPYRRLFRTPFWGEGWALYWELLLWDMNFAKSPENRIGMLFWRMHRCARIIFSLNFHLEKMTPQECVDFLVNRVGHERDNAEAEVRRSFNGADGPLYQCAYMIGGLQIRALHHDLVDSGKMTNRAFHDELLKQNSLPIEMMRASLTKQNLTRDFQSSWRFYGLDSGGVAPGLSSHRSHSTK